MRASQPNRTAKLRRITVPTLIIYGLHDPPVAVSGGLAEARAMRGIQITGRADVVRTRIDDLRSSRGSKLSPAANAG